MLILSLCTPIISQSQTCEETLESCAFAVETQKATIKKLVNEAYAQDQRADVLNERIDELNEELDTQKGYTIWSTLATILLILL